MVNINQTSGGYRVIKYQATTIDGRYTEEALVIATRRCFSHSMQRNIRNIGKLAKRASRQANHSR